MSAEEDERDQGFDAKATSQMPKPELDELIAASQKEPEVLDAARSSRPIGMSSRTLWIIVILAMLAGAFITLFLTRWL
jgi:hypothetical protein